MNDSRNPADVGERYLQLRQEGKLRNEAAEEALMGDNKPAKTRMEVKIGLYSFIDVDGIRWYAEGISESCGPEYVDFQNADGTKHTVRRKVDVIARGLRIPERGVPLVRQEAQDADVTDELGLMTPEEREVMSELDL